MATRRGIALSGLPAPDIEPTTARYGYDKTTVSVGGKQVDVTALTIIVDAIGGRWRRLTTAEAGAIRGGRDDYVVRRINGAWWTPCSDRATTP